MVCAHVEVYLVFLPVGFTLVVRGRRTQGDGRCSTGRGLAPWRLILAGGGAREPPVAASQRRQLLQDVERRTLMLKKTLEDAAKKKNCARKKGMSGVTDLQLLGFVASACRACCSPPLPPWPAWTWTLQISVGIRACFHNSDNLNTAAGCLCPPGANP